MNLYSLGPRLSELAAATNYASAVTDAMRVLENSSVHQTINVFKERDALMSASLKPLAEIQRASDSLAHSPLIEEMRRASKVRAELEAHFRQPDFGELRQLVAGFQNSPLAASLGGPSTDLQRAMEQMATPWVDVRDAMRSIGGLAELQGISLALGSLAGFDDGLAAALRADLGDWRDPISWRPEIINDLGLRARFYTDIGFNHNLTAFPPAAFHEGLVVTGVRGRRPPLVALYGTPVPLLDNEKQETEFERTATAYDWLHRLESQLRGFIDGQMTGAFGANWPKHRLPNGMHEQWKEKERKAQATGAPERPLIAYADFTDYTLVICRVDNWRKVFAAFFGRPESVRESFQRLYPIRVDTMHARHITQDDELLLYVEAHRLMRMIRGQ